MMNGVSPTDELVKREHEYVEEREISANIIAYNDAVDRHNGTGSHNSRHNESPHNDSFDEQNGSATVRMVDYSAVVNHQSHASHGSHELKREVMEESIGLSSAIDEEQHYHSSGASAGVVGSAGGLWWTQNQTPVVTTSAYDLSGNGVITSVAAKSGRLNGTGAMINDYWYGSQATAHPNNVIQIGTTPTTIATTSSADHYLSYGQNQSQSQNTFQSQTQQLVLRSGHPQSSGHRRSNSGCEGGMPDLFSPTEGRECVNCGKH